MIKCLNQVHRATTLAFLFFIFSLFVLSKLISLVLSPVLILLIFLVIFSPAIISSTLFTIVYIRNLIRSKNIYLIGCYSVFCFIKYQISSICAKNMIYEALGYNPKYLPYATSFISAFLQLPVGLFLIAYLMMIFVNTIFLCMTAMVKFFPFGNKVKCNERQDKFYHLGLGVNILSIVVILLIYYSTSIINYNVVIRAVALVADYYPIEQSTSTCKEASSYELFNYLSGNMISVYKFDHQHNKYIFRILECATV